MMSCNEVLDAMHRYLDGELDEREVTGFESHLLDCATCRAEHSRWQEAVDVIRGAREAYRPPESSERRVLELVRQAEQQTERAQQSWQWCRAAAVILLAGGLGATASRSGSMPPNRTCVTHAAA